MSSYADKALRCVSCGADFVFTAREQEFHAAKGFANEPRRCLACRQARRGSSGGAPGTGRSHAQAGERAGSTRAASAATADRRMYAAVCSACGGEASLPFEPVGNRPVLCHACYAKIQTRA
jgi:CxxC-x17-CxxC domain-containing protein